jgi:hypothetical protein
MIRTPNPEANVLATENSEDNKENNSPFVTFRGDSSAYDGDSDASEDSTIVLDGEPELEWTTSTLASLPDSSRTLNTTATHDPTLPSSPPLYYNTTTSEEEENSENAGNRAKSAVCRQLHFPNQSGDGEE